MTSITLGIPVYNSEKFLPDLFASLKKQSRLPDEIIITDDQSTDHSFSLIEKFIIENPHIRIKKLQNASNLGIAANYNIIFENASCDWIQIIDSDDYPLNKYYSLIESKLDEKSSAAIITAIKTNSVIFNFLNRIIILLIPKHIPRWLQLLGFITVRSAVIYKKEFMHKFIDPVFDGSDIVHLDELRKKGNVVFVKNAKLFYRIHQEANTNKLPGDSYIDFLRTLRGKKKFFFTLDFILRKKVFSFIRKTSD